MPDVVTSRVLYRQMTIRDHTGQRRPLRPQRHVYEGMSPGGLVNPHKDLLSFNRDVGVTAVRLEFSARPSGEVGNLVCDELGSPIRTWRDNLKFGCVAAISIHTNRPANACDRECLLACQSGKRDSADEVFLSEEKDE